MGGVKGSNTAAHVSEIDPQKMAVRVKRRAPVIAVERNAQGSSGAKSLMAILCRRT
jgi:hypothetical protein